MAHFNQNRNSTTRQHQGGRGTQGGNAPRLPQSFDKGEIIDGLVFSMVPSRNGAAFVAAILTDGTVVEPGSYGEYRFNPVLDEKPYLCSVMGGNGKWSALPVYYRELSPNEWVHEQPQRACLTAVLVFEMSDERHTGREPRPISRLPDGRTVILERGYEDKVQLGSDTRVALTEPRNARSVGNLLFAIPLAASAAKPTRQQEDDESLTPPEQPADPLKVTVRSFERKQTAVTVRSLADVNVRDRQVSIYEMLSYGQLGIRTTVDSTVQTVKANANKIADSLEGSVHKNTPKHIRESVFARVDAIGEAVRRAIAALGKTDAPSAVPNAKANEPTVSADGNKPKRRNRRRNRRSGQEGAQSTQGGTVQRPRGNRAEPAKQNVVRAPGTATIGDAVGAALTKGAETAPPASQPTVAPAPELPSVVDPFDNGGHTALVSTVDETDTIDVTDADDVIVAPEAPAPVAKIDEFESAYGAMATELKVTVPVLKAAIAKSGLDPVEFSEKPKNMRMFYVRQVNASKSA